MKKSKMGLSRDEVSRFERVQAQLQSVYKEFGALSTKKADDGVNKFKLKLVNKVLGDANELLGVEKPFADFDQFDEDEVPTNSDVLIMLSQYLNCLEKLRADNITSDYEKSWYWVIDGQASNHQTAPPSKLKY